MSAALVLMGFSLLGAFLVFNGGEDDEDTSDPQETDSETDTGPETETGTDIGATVTEDEAGNVSIELGEDETGSLVLFNYSDSEDVGIGLSETYELRLYILLEGSSIPEFSEEGFGGAELDDLEDQLGLQLIGSWPLGTVLPTSEEPYFIDNRSDPPTISANAPIAEYNVEANTDGDDLIYLRPVDYVPPPPTFNGALQQVVTSDTTGTDGSDWITAQAQGITLSGLDGADLLEANAFNVTLNGGEGDDDLRGWAEGTMAYGGGGDDDIDLVGGGTAFGGTGEDTLRSFTFGNSTLYGEDGNDNLQIYGTGSEGHGGAGDDFLGVNNGATGYGGPGNDHLQVEAGGIGFGGEGNDLLRVWEQHRADEDTPVLTGGEGADTFDLRVRNPYGTDTVPFTRITDFDPAEDVLQVGVFQTSGSSVSGVSMTEAADGSYTDVEVQFANRYATEPGVAIIRLDGVTGLSPDAVVILT